MREALLLAWVASRTTRAPGMQVPLDSVPKVAQLGTLARAPWVAVGAEAVRGALEPPVAVPQGKTQAVMLQLMHL